MRDKFDKKLYQFKKKDDALSNYINYDLDRTSRMFKYDGLPNGIDPIRMELRLQQHGYLILLHLDESEFKDVPNVKKPESGVYALYGGVGGVLDLNQDFTLANIAHPLLKTSKELVIGEECVLLRNDTLMMGLLPLLERYGTQLVENDITLNIANIESRIISLITAGNDTGLESAKEFISKIVAGDLSVIHDSNFDVDGQVKTLPYSTSANNTITNLIEFQQYVKASKDNELGLSGNYNMKRESINSGEAQLGLESKMVLVDDMLACRKQAWEQANEMFGLNVIVDLEGAWQHNHDELELADEEEQLEINGDETELVDTNEEDTNGDNTNEDNTNEEIPTDEDKEEKKDETE